MLQNDRTNWCEQLVRTITNTTKQSHYKCIEAVAMTELQTEAVIAILSTKGISSLGGRSVAGAAIGSSESVMPIGPLMRGPTGRVTARNLLEKMSMDAVRKKS